MRGLKLLGYGLWHLGQGAFGYGVVLYLSFGVVYALLRWVVGDKVVIVTLGNILLPYFLLLAVFMLPVALLFRWWWHGAGLGIFVLAFVVLYGGLFLPRFSSVRADTNQTIRVMTFNTAVHYTRADELVDLVRGSDADIIALVELDQDNAIALADSLSAIYPYQVDAGGGVGGKGLISRYPIQSTNVFTMLTSRPNIEAVLDVNGTRVRVFVVHPPSPNFSQTWNFYTPDPQNKPEIEMLLARAEGDMPTLLLGDFNITDQNRIYQTIQHAGYTDAFRQSGFGFGGTFYQQSFRLTRRQRVWLWRDPPLARIDYVFFSSHFRPLEAVVWEGMNSDHAPLVATLALWDEP